MDWPLNKDSLRLVSHNGPRYETIAQIIRSAIEAGRVGNGERLPTVRQLSKDLGVSGTTIVGAYHMLENGGWIRSEVGRGTFVNGPSQKGVGRTFEPEAGRARAPQDRSQRARQTFVPWRRRALMASAGRLRAAYAQAADCTSGRPDPALLPLAILQRAWHAAISATTHADLQYFGPSALDSLAQQLLPRFAADGVPARQSDLVIGSSAQQFMVLALQIVAESFPSSRVAVAVEEPGYPTIFDTFEHAGYRLLGVEVDQQGATAASLDAALTSGARAVLFTPRAHNPTGASWTAHRRAELADVLAAHPEVVAIEDDQFAGIATTASGSLLDDARLEDRVIYIRSFSKSLAPDLRMAVAVARPPLRTRLAEAKSFADGWSSRLAQRTLTLALADGELDDALAAAHHEYERRRRAAAHAINESAQQAGPWTWHGIDGVNIWVHVPLHIDSTAVIEQAAASGVLVAPGEPFFIRPGHTELLRINAGSVPVDTARMAGTVLRQAVQTAAGYSSDTIPV